jgi:hypothetical protein
VRLENALRHLDASNAELREALARDGPDQARPLPGHDDAAQPTPCSHASRARQDYEEALRENVDVMSGMLAKARPTGLRQRIGLLSYAPAC